MNPIPRIDLGLNSGGPRGWEGCVPTALGHDKPFPVSESCPQFKPLACKEVGNPPWHAIPGGRLLPNGFADGLPESNVEGRCSGDFISASIVDMIIIPEDLPSGEYVLGWRWDGEETAQIWASCADV